MPAQVTISGAPAWSSHTRLLRGRIPPALVAWLLDTGSLTDRLKKACHGHFEVRVVEQGWQRPRLDERRALDMRHGMVGWVRQVQLLCNGTPWVFARTIVPVTTLTGAQRRLAYLGNRPLGAFLFADPGMQRGPVEVAAIRNGQAMFGMATAGLKRKPAAIWGRRSVFRVGGKPLLVTEVFLPAIGTCR